MPSTRQARCTLILCFTVSPLGCCCSCGTVTVIGVAVAVAMAVLGCGGQAAQGMMEWKGPPLDDCPFAGFQMGFPLGVRPIS